MLYLFGFDDLTQKVFVAGQDNLSFEHVEGYCELSVRDLTYNAAMGVSHANRQTSAELKHSLYLAEDCQVPLEALCSVGYWACV